VVFSPEGEKKEGRPSCSVLRLRRLIGGEESEGIGKGIHGTCAPMEKKRRRKVHNGRARGEKEACEGGTRRGVRFGGGKKKRTSGRLYVLSPAVEEKKRGEIRPNQGSRRNLALALSEREGKKKGEERGLG